MDANSQVLLLGAALLFAAILLGALSSRAGIPFLLVFLVVGMLAGEDGPGGLQFDDTRLAFAVGNLALAVILLDGGLRTRYQAFRLALKPALALATVGVLATAALVGAAAVYLLDVDWRVGVLLGAIVGSTDGAAVFSLVRSGGTRLHPRIANTLEIESGANDPMAIFLTATLIAAIQHPAEATVAKVVWSFVRQFGIGALAGFALGSALAALLAATLARVRLAAGLHALLLCAGGVAVFAAANLLGGSGFLAVYLAGLVLGNRPLASNDEALSAMDGLAWLAQSAMFLLLGLLATPSRVFDIAVPALLVSAFLMIAARPVSVWVTLLPFGYRRNELVFLSWVGLRGAVPIVLALFPLLADIPDARLLFDVAFMVVLTSLLLQGTSIPRVARAFGVVLPPRAEPASRVRLEGSGDMRDAFLQFPVLADTVAVGESVASLHWPEGVRVVHVMRRGAVLLPETSGPLAPGDVVGLLATGDAAGRLAGLFATGAALAPGASAAMFVLAGNARIADVFALYGQGEPPADLAQLSLDDALNRQLRGRATEGDAAIIAGLDLVIVEMTGDHVTRVALRLLPAQPRASRKRRST